MSGHSKWSTIKRQKGAADTKRGLTFTKIANAITIAAKQGGGDPNSNSRLRVAMEAARAVNMPKENVTRAVDRGLGKLPGQVIEEVTYEGFGPGRVAFLVEGVTDNKLRTNQEIKSVFERSGGVVAGQGAVSYMFDKKGEIRVKGKGGSVEDEMLELIDLGAEDVESFDYFDYAHHKFAQDFADAQEKQRYLVYVESPELNTMGTKITQAGYEVESSEITMKPNVVQEIKDTDEAKKVIEFAEKLEEHDDIQKVYSNMDIPGELIS